MIRTNIYQPHNGTKIYAVSKTADRYFKAMDDVAEVFTGERLSAAFDAIWRVAINDPYTTGGDLDSIKEYMNDMENINGGEIW